MRHAVQNILLSLSFLLAFTGLQWGAALEVKNSGAHALAVQDSLHDDKVSELYATPGLAQAEEQVRVWQPRPSPPHKQSSSMSPALAWVQEIRFQLQVTQYLQRTVDFCPGLRGCDIIFPFHYFW